MATRRKVAIASPAGVLKLCLSSPFLRYFIRCGKSDTKYNDPVGSIMCRTLCFTKDVVALVPINDRISVFPVAPSPVMKSTNNLDCSATITVSVMIFASRPTFTFPRVANTARIWVQLSTKRTKKITICDRPRHPSCLAEKNLNQWILQCVKTDNTLRFSESFISSTCSAPCLFKTSELMVFYFKTLSAFVLEPNPVLYDL